MQNRRDFLHQSACGFGALATSALATQAAQGMGSGLGLHHAARAKRVIFLFMQGGVSQVDSFDYKPELEKRDGQMLPFDDAREFANTRKLGAEHRVMKSPWAFKRYGESGRIFSQVWLSMPTNLR
jgi:Protein of unknown function (DUF1501)